MLYRMDKKKQLTKDDIARLKMVERFDTKFSSTNSNKLYEGLKKRYSNVGTLSVLCYSLKKYFDLENKEDKCNFWGSKGAELSTINNHNEAKNELTGNEIKNWKTQDQILQIMNNMKIKSKTDANRFLLLAMCILQPPLRKGFYQSAKFLDNMKKNDHESNYVFLQPPENGKSYYIVNEDKVSRYENFNNHENKFIEIDNPKLIRLLMKSYVEDPRTYIFEIDDGTPYALSSISKVLLENPFGLNFNILRSSYITNYFNVPDHDYLEAREELARKMRHSVEKQMRNYQKRVK